MGQRWTLRIIGESGLLSPDGQETKLPAQPKRFAVLVFLALSVGARARRDVLVSMFWPELENGRARNALRATLHHLRRVAGPDLIRGSGEDEISLDRDALHLDLTDLERALESGDPTEWLRRPSLQLVPGLHVPDAPAFQEWLDSQRRSLADRIVRLAWPLADAAAAAGDLPRAVTIARATTRLLREDETGLRRLVLLLDRCGDRSGALSEFEDYRSWLRDQFDAEPSPETAKLVRQIRERTRTLSFPTPIQAVPARPMHGVAAPSVSSASATPLRAEHGAPLKQARARTATWVGAALIATALAIGAWSVRRPSDRASPAPGAHVAILPFGNEVADTTVAYLATALGENVADGLPSPATLPYDALMSVDARDRAAARRRARGVDAGIVVFGALSGTRDSLILDMAVEDVDGRALAAPRRVVGSEKGLILLRDSAVSIVARAARLPIDTASARHAPAAAAYQMSLNASWLLGRRTRAELLAARDLYTRALEIDPGWEELWIGLARVTGALAYRHFIDYRTGFRMSEHAANEALRRAPRDARAVIERSLARFSLGDFPGAEADARLAGALDSTDARMQSLIGTWWQWSGSHLDSALKYTRRAQSLAPWDRQIAINILQIVGCMPDSELVLREAQHVLDIDANEPEALETLAWTLTRFGRWDEATAAYARRFRPSVSRELEARTHVLRGEARFRAMVRGVRERMYAEQRLRPPPTPPLLENRIALFEDLGLRDSSIAALSSVVDSVDVHHANMMCAPNLRDFRRDPRTQAIVRSRGWPIAEFTPGERVR